MAATRCIGRSAIQKRTGKTKDRAKNNATKLRAMAALTGAVAGNPHASPETLATFARLNAIATGLMANRDWVVRKPIDLAEVEALLRSVSTNQAAIDSVVRRFAKLARGRLHPARLRQALL